jgi:uncharacterized heparinase superfamily protein
VEGSFTSWCAPLERAALKKDRFLNPKPPRLEAAPPGPEAAPPTAADSLFAGKLKQALQPADPKQES